MSLHSVKHHRPRRPRTVAPTKPRGGRARALTKHQMELCIKWVRANSNSPEGDELKLLLSFKAGLRVCEIRSAVHRRPCLTPTGTRRRSSPFPQNIQRVSPVAKIPMHTEIKRALRNVLKLKENITHVAYKKVGDHIEYQSSNCLAQWFRRLYIKVGLQGCSSHSGRRSFITELARTANLHGSSMRDVQILAGHARMDTTEAYIDQSSSVSRLINSL